MIAIFSGFWTSNYGKKYELFVEYRYGPFIEGLLSFGTLMVLTNSMIPISLIISLEMVKLAQAYFINNDNEMYNAESDRNSKVFMSSLNEELG
jgi:magnesium-transporting ATPase (P-type)